MFIKFHGSHAALRSSQSLRLAHYAGANALVSVLGKASSPGVRLRPKTRMNITCCLK